MSNNSLKKYLKFMTEVISIAKGSMYVDRFQNMKNLIESQQELSPEMVRDIEVSIKTLQNKINGSRSSSSVEPRTKVKAHKNDYVPIETICISSDEENSRFPEQNKSNTDQQPCNENTLSNQATASEKREVQKQIQNAITDKDNDNLSNIAKSDRCEVQIITHDINLNFERDNNVNDENCHPNEIDSVDRGNLSELSENSDNMNKVKPSLSAKRKRRKISSSSYEIAVEVIKEKRTKKRRVIRRPASESSSEGEYYSAKSSPQRSLTSDNQSESGKTEYEYSAKNLETLKIITTNFLNEHKSTDLMTIYNALTNNLGEKIAKSIEHFLKKCANKNMLDISNKNNSTSRNIDVKYENMFIFIKSSLDSIKISHNPVETSKNLEQNETSSEIHNSSERSNSSKKKDTDNSVTNEGDTSSEKENNMAYKSKAKKRMSKRSSKSNELEKLRKDIGNSFIRDELLSLKPRNHKNVNYNLSDNNSESSDDDSMDENEMPPVNKKYCLRRRESFYSQNRKDENDFENDDISHSEHDEDSIHLDSNRTTPDGLLPKSHLVVIPEDNDENRSTPDIDVSDQRIRSFEKSHQIISDEEFDTDCSSGPSVRQFEDMQKVSENSSEESEDENNPVFHFISKENITSCRLNVERYDITGYSFPAKVYQDNGIWKIKAAPNNNNNTNDSKSDINMADNQSGQNAIESSNNEISKSNGTTNCIQQNGYTAYTAINLLHIESRGQCNKEDIQSVMSKSYSSSEKITDTKKEATTVVNLTFNPNEVIFIDDDDDVLPETSSKMDDIPTKDEKISKVHTELNKGHISTNEKNIDIDNREETRSVSPDRLMIIDGEVITPDIKENEDTAYTQKKDNNIQAPETVNEDIVSISMQCKKTKYSTANIDTNPKVKDCISPKKSPKQSVNNPADIPTSSSKKSKISSNITPSSKKATNPRKSPNKSVKRKILSMVQDMELKVLNLSFIPCRAGFYFKCNTGSCTYSNLREETFKYHLESRHPIDRWAGFCNICGKSFSRQTLPLIKEYEHMLEYHVKDVNYNNLKDDNTQKVAKKLNISTDSSQNSDCVILSSSPEIQTKTKSSSCHESISQTCEASTSRNIFETRRISEEIKHAKNASDNENSASSDDDKTCNKDSNCIILISPPESPLSPGATEESLQILDTDVPLISCDKASVNKSINEEVAESVTKKVEENSQSDKKLNDTVKKPLEKQLLRFKLLPGDKLSGKNDENSPSSDSGEKSSLDLLSGLTFGDKDRQELMHKLSSSASNYRLLETQPSIHRSTIPQTVNYTVPITVMNSPTLITSTAPIHLITTFPSMAQIPKPIIRIPNSSLIASTSSTVVSNLAISSEKTNGRNILPCPSETIPNNSAFNTPMSVSASKNVVTNNLHPIMTSTLNTTRTAFDNNTANVGTHTAIPSGYNDQPIPSTSSGHVTIRNICSQEQIVSKRPTAKVAPSPKNFPNDMEMGIPKTILTTANNIDSILSTQLQCSSNYGYTSKGTTQGCNLQQSHANILLQIKSTKVLRPWLSEADIKSVDHVESMLTVENLKKLFKCMFAYCDFCTNNSTEFKEHLNIHQKKASGSLIYRCCYCVQTFDKSMDLIYHINKMGYKCCKFFCSRCFYRTSSQYKLGEHAKIHAQTSNFNSTQFLVNQECEEISIDQEFKMIKLKEFEMIKCPICGLQFHTYQQIRNHQNQFHKTFSFECKKCSVRDTSNNLYNHYTNCYGIYNFYCCYCSFGSQELNNISNHLVHTHIEKLPFYFERSDVSHLSTPSLKKAACVKKFSSTFGN